MAKVQRHGHGQETGDVMMATGLQLPLSQGDFRGCPMKPSRGMKGTLWLTMVHDDQWLIYLVVS